MTTHEIIRHRFQLKLVRTLIYVSNETIHEDLGNVFRSVDWLQTTGEALDTNDLLGTEASQMVQKNLSYRLEDSQSDLLSGYIGCNSVMR